MNISLSKPEQAYQSNRSAEWENMMWRFSNSCPSETRGKMVLMKKFSIGELTFFCMRAIQVSETNLSN